MKRTILATCLAATCAVVLSAQTPSPQSPTQQPPTSTTGTTGADQSGAQHSRGPMTITGCLKAGDTADTFTLTNVKGMGKPAGTTGETAPSTTGGAPTTAPEGGQAAMSVTLTPASDVDLKAHVGHQIEVTGTPARGAGAGGTTAGGTTTGGTTAGGTSTGGTSPSATATSGRARNLNVTKVKMISESCSQ
jgi:hypothetical protein